MDQMWIKSIPTNTQFERTHTYARTRARAHTHTHTHSHLQALLSLCEVNAIGRQQSSASSSLPPNTPDVGGHANVAWRLQAVRL